MIDFIGLELINFHDVPIKSINFGNNPSYELVLEIMLWDEDINDYVHNQLVFGEICHIKPEKSSIKKNSELEIYSFDYYLENNLFCGKLTCLMGFEKQSLVIEFSCQSVEIKTEHNKNV